MTKRLEVLVTGAGRGIGRSLALRFAQEGARIALCARTRSEIEWVASEVGQAGGVGLATPLDVTDEASIEEGVARFLHQTDGVLDVLVNNAGVFSIQPFADVTPTTWTQTIATNLTGPFLVTRAALRGLARSTRAHVFNISSIAGLRAFPGNAAYCASKFGLRGFGDALRYDLAAQGIRVSTVYPSATDTGIFDGVPGNWDRSKMYHPDEVAERVWRAYSSPRGEDVADLELAPRFPTRE